MSTYWLSFCFLLPLWLLIGLVDGQDWEHEKKVFTMRTQLVNENVIRRGKEAQQSSSSSSSMTPPENKRKTFPEEEPLVCLAFLSCCGRTDLLKHTMGGLIRHLEYDEPDTNVKYEIAWVDNGSSKEQTDEIMELFDIEHALPMETNQGLAWGMNALIQNLCTAPYILLLEEDWLYMDDAVAEQTEERKGAISRALAVTMAGLKEPTGGRQVIGVQLRDKPGITKPLLESTLTTVLPGQENTEKETNIDYVLYGMNIKETQHVFGSYTNGAGLYSRAELVKVGRMYGEPLDTFHDGYVESNYAFRVGLRYCIGTIILQEECDGRRQDCSDLDQVAAFRHIGGGRGTRPAKKDDNSCLDESWHFYGTSFYDQATSASSKNKDCNLLSIEDQLKKNIEFQKLNAERNKKVFEKEQERRNKILEEVSIIIKYLPTPHILRELPMFKDFTDDQIVEYTLKAQKMANSPHQLPGFWDNFGQPINSHL